MAFPEHLQQGLKADPLGIKHDAHHFGVTGAARAHFLIGGVGRDPARIACGRVHHAWQLPEHALHAPETAHGEYRLFMAIGHSSFQRAALDEMRRRCRQGLYAAGQGFARRHKVGFPLRITAQAHRGTPENLIRGEHR